jgi:hypothetical protein
MAKKDLDFILKKVKARIDESNTLRDELDRKTHEYSISTASVYKEFLSQLKGLIENIDNPGPSEVRRRKNALKVIVRDYVDFMFSALKSKRGASRSTRYVFSQGSNNESFAVTISSPSSSNTNIFAILRDIRRDESRGLPAVRKKILDQVFSGSSDRDVDRALYGSLDNATGVRSGGLVQLGHDKAGSVSLRRKAQLLKEFQYKSNVDRLLTGTSISKETRAEINLAVRTFATSSYNTLKDFSVVVKLTEESAFRNQRDAAGEKAFLRALTKEIRSTLKNEVDFFNQRGSPSATEIVRNRLINTAIKAGAKAKKPTAIKNSKNKASTKIQGKTTRSRSKETVSVTVPTLSQDREPNANWLRLIPIINARLTDKVMQNMKAPRLVNRTGRFAQSARVTRVEETPQGHPSFVFDYERDPYNVFDRRVGRAPWNTPQRDPRALVDQSVREIVRDMAIGRFFTRREQ